MSEPTVRFAETPSSYLSRIYHGQSKRNTAQQAFIFYGACAGAGSFSLLLWHHSLAVRKFFGFYPTRLVVPAVLVTALAAEQINTNYSRRPYRILHRFDINWREMPAVV